MLGGILGKVLDLQKRFLLASSDKLEQHEPDMLLAKEIML
jgi:hypothetical protein